MNVPDSFKNFDSIPITPRNNDQQIPELDQPPGLEPVEVKTKTISIDCLMTPNPAAVKANNKNKLEGSGGQTIVIKLAGKESEANQKTAIALRQLQGDLCVNLGQKVAVTKHLPPDEKDTETARHFRVINKENPTKGKDVSENAAFVRIKNIHTTVSSQFVVDSYSQSEWEEALDKTNFRMAGSQLVEQGKLDKSEFNTIMTQIEDKMKTKEGKTEHPFRDSLREIVGEGKNLEEIARVVNHLESDAFLEGMDEAKEKFLDKYQDKEIVLKPNTQSSPSFVKVAPNGAVLIEWDGGNALKELKKDVASIGGTLKYGTLDNPTSTVGTTIGFIPGYDQLTPKDKEVLNKVLNKNIKSLADKEIKIKPSDLFSVYFHRNDLNVLLSRESRIGSDEKIRTLKTGHDVLEKEIPPVETFDTKTFVTEENPPAA